MAISARAIRAGAAYVELLVNDNKLVRGLRNAQRKLNNFGGGLKSVGRNLTMLGAAAVTPFAASVKILTGFSDQMAKVRAITGASDKDFQRLNDTAKQLGSTTSFSASEVAQGMQFLGMAGFNTEQVLAGIPSVLKLARAGAIELGEAADIASDVGSAFGISADQIQRVADVMATTASSANTSISMMGETLKYAAPIAKAAGQSIEDTAAAVGVLGNSGIKATMAGTDLAIILKEMSSGDAAEKLREIGVATTNSDGSVRSLVDVMQELGEATKSMSESERLGFMSAAFKRAAKSAIILADAGDGFTDLQTKINHSTGSVDRMAATMEDTIGGAFRSFLSAVEGLAIGIGDALAPEIRDWTNSITSNIQTVVEWLKENRGLVVTIAKLTAGVIAGGIALYGLGTVFGALSSIVSFFAGTTIFAGSAIGIMGTLISALLTPVGAIVAAVGLAAAAFIDWGSVGQKATSFLSEAFRVLKDDALKTFGGISDAMAAGDLGLAAEILWASLKVEWERGLLYLKGLWDNFLDTTLGKMFSWQLDQTMITWEVVKFFGKALGIMFNDFLQFANAIQKAWNSVSQFFRKTWAKVKGVVAGTDSQAEITRIEQESGTSEISGTLGNNSDAALKEAIARRDELIAEAERKREENNKKNLTPDDSKNKELDSQLKDLQNERSKLKDTLAELNNLPETPNGTPPDIQQIENGAMAFDSFMGNIRNTALEMGTAETQAAIIDALTGRNNPQKEIADATKETAKNTKKTQKDVATQTTLMRSGIRLIVENA